MAGQPRIPPFQPPGAAAQPMGGAAPLPPPPQGQPIVGSPDGQTMNPDMLRRQVMRQLLGGAQ